MTTFDSFVEAQTDQKLAKYREFNIRIWAPWEELLPRLRILSHYLAIPGSCASVLRVKGAMSQCGAHRLLRVTGLAGGAVAGGVRGRWPGAAGRGGHRAGAGGGDHSLVRTGRFLFAVADHGAAERAVSRHGGGPHGAPALLKDPCRPDKPQAHPAPYPADRPPCADKRRMHRPRGRFIRPTPGCAGLLLLCRRPAPGPMGWRAASASIAAGRRSYGVGVRHSGAIAAGAPLLPERL